jgi:acyl-CoA thioesterase
MEKRILQNILLEEVLERNPALSLVGVSRVELSASGDASVSMTVGERHTNIHKMVHGGLFVVLLDTAMGCACYYQTGIGAVTLNITTSFLANCPVGAQVAAAGRLVRAGKRVVLAEGEVRDEQNRLLATAEATFFLLRENEAEF